MTEPIADDLSPKMRSYLAEVYRLADMAAAPEDYVSTSALADLLDVSAPAVNRMVNRLKEQDLIEHEPYQGIRLTEKGRSEALKQLRNQRIAEAFLVQVMGFDWADVHDEAMRISSALGEVLIQRMYTMASEPRFSPLGEPIPTVDGTVAHVEDMLLSDVPANSLVRVTRMRTRETDRLQYIHALGLIPGTEFEVLHVAPFSGPMQLKIGGEYRIIGHNLAELIRVGLIGQGHAE